MRRVCRMDEVKVGPFEVGKLGDPESRVKKGPDDEFPFVDVGTSPGDCRLPPLIPTSNALTSPLPVDFRSCAKKDCVILSQLLRIYATQNGTCNGC